MKGDENMLSSKLLYIKDCNFALPDDFEGSLGDALSLLAEYRLKKEKENKITNRPFSPSLPTTYEDLQNNDNAKCSVHYAIYKISEDGTSWEPI
jgi:hypothetical protein